MLDLATTEGTSALHSLLATADAVIDDHDADWLERLGLDPGQLEQRYPAVVFCSITPCGLSAPPEWRHIRSLNVFHRSGWGYHTPSSPDPARPPLKGPGRFLVDYEAGLDAALCTAAALYWRRNGGSGQHIDVSQLEVMMSRADTVIGRLLAGDDEAGNDRSLYDQRGPRGFFPCADGAVYLYMTSRKHWKGLCELMGNPEWTRSYDDDWLEFGVTDERVAECQSQFAAWVRDKAKDAVSEQAQRLGVPIVPVNNAADLHRSPQFIFREFFRRLEHPVLGPALYPTVPYKLSASPATLATPAPRLGQHTEAVLHASHISTRAPAATKATAGAKDAIGNEVRQDGPLAGVRVLELTKVWAGPYAGKLLAFLGAEVIKIESRHNMDEMRAYGGVDPNHAPYFLSLNPEILSVQLNLKSPQGLELLRQLVAKSDIVLNNLRPGAMERMGFGYEQLRAIKPDIISVSIKMWGNDGPLGYQTGYAPCFASLAGFNYLVGYEGEPPAGINMRYGDATVGANAAFAAVAALLHRQRTGEGQFVDVSAVECLSSLIGDSLLAYSLTGQIPEPDGNRHADMAPHGCYPCRDGEWLSLAVATDDEWRTLCHLLERPALAEDPCFSTRAQRLQHYRELDARLAELTAGQSADALAARLRAAGLAACKSHSSLDVLQDEYLWNRQFYCAVSDKRDGTRPIVGAPWRLSKTPRAIVRGAPDLGEHNAYVYREVLGLSAERFQQLIDNGIIE